MTLESNLNTIYGPDNHFLSGQQKANARQPDVGSQPDEQGQTQILGYSKNDIAPEYMIAIKCDRPANANGYPNKGGTKTNVAARNVVIIRAPIEESITLKLESTWAPVVQSHLPGDVLGKISQLATGRALESKYMSRRIWTGTTPLDFTLNLKFKAYNNTKLDVVQPCMELQKMILPYSGGKVAGELLLSPPGPSPFKELSNFVSAHEKGEIITIAYGMFLLIKRVIIKDVEIKYLSQMAITGEPVEAEAMVHCQTYEILTKESIGSLSREDGVYNTFRTSIENA